MSIEGQGHFFTICFPGFVCFVLYKAKISGERLQDHWSSGFFSYLEVTHLISPFFGTQRVGEDHPSEHLTNYIGELCVYKKAHSFFVPLSH